MTASLWALAIALCCLCASQQVFADDKGSFSPSANIPPSANISLKLVNQADYVITTEIGLPAQPSNYQVSSSPSLFLVLLVFLLLTRSSLSPSIKVFNLLLHTLRADVLVIDQRSCAKQKNVTFNCFDYSSSETFEACKSNCIVNSVSHPPTFSLFLQLLS